MFTVQSALTRFVLGVAVATAGVPALAAAPQGTSAARPTSAAPVISKASYNRGKGMLVIVGTGFDQTATVRLNGVELTGEHKFRAEKGKLRVVLPAGSTQLKAEGQNRLEVVQGQLSSGEFQF